MLVSLLVVLMAGTAWGQRRRRRHPAPAPKPAPARPTGPAAATEAAPPTDDSGASVKEETEAHGDKRTKVFDFTGLDIAGRMKTPQLLYFLDRATEELARASLERRSFIPTMIRSVEEESL